MGGGSNSASPQRTSDNKTEHLLLYLEDFLDFSCCFFGGGAKATHLPVVAYSVLQYSYNFYRYHIRYIL